MSTTCFHGEALLMSTHNMFFLGNKKNYHTDTPSSLELYN